MFKLFRRFVAYFIDMMVVLIIVQTISSIPFINNNIDKYNKIYNNYMDEFYEYNEFKLDLKKYYEDEKLSNKEYNKLKENYSNKEKILNKYYKDNKLSSKNYDKLLKELDDIYLKDYKETYYKLDKYSIVFNVSYVVVVLLYFVLFNMITDGVTLGKKLTRLRIVNNKDENDKVSVISYVIRSIMLYQVIYYLVKAIFVNVLSMGDYFTLSNLVYDIHSYLIFIILTFVVVRMDGRGLHDIVSGTKVIEVKRNKKV